MEIDAVILPSKRDALPGRAAFGVGWPAARLPWSGRRSPMNEWTPQRLEGVLSGDEDGLRALVRDLTPVVHARAGRALLRRRSIARGEDPRQRVADVAQDVYVELFRDRAKLLRSWDPARGLSLASFVGLVTEQRVAATLRSSRRNPWAEALGDGQTEVGADVPAGAADPEERLLSRDAVERLLDMVRAQLSPVGLDMFYRLVVREEAIASVCAATGMSTSAVQAWSSRLKRLVQGLARDVLAEEGAES
jgi:DNA-directed RNA polymerase specialized sigma24 family protein